MVLATACCPPEYVTSRTQTVGWSEEKRPLNAIRMGDPTARRRVLVIAGQHGDEPLASEAVASLTANAGWWEALEGIEVSLIPTLNPDGQAGGTRVNAAGLDLNRDHQLLESPEVSALHAYCRSFQPELVIDVHTFRARRRTWLAQGFEIGEEIMLELENHPAVLDGYAARCRDRLDPIRSVLASQGIATARYVLMRTSGRIRTSSADVVDARNGLSLSFGIPTLLVEGREPTSRWGSTARTRMALQTAVQVALERWATAGPWTIPGQEDPRVYLGAERLHSSEPVRCRTVAKGDRAPTDRTLSGRNELGLRATTPCELPAAYGVPQDRRELVAVLHRHGFVGRPVSSRLQVEHARVLDVRPSTRPSRAPHRLRLEWERRHADPGTLLWYAAPASRRNMLASLLEPTSRYGLHRHTKLRVSLKPGEDYPVVRAIDFKE